MRVRVRHVTTCLATCNSYLKAMERLKQLSSQKRKTSLTKPNTQTHSLLCTRIQHYLAVVQMAIVSEYGTDPSIIVCCP
jgi:hypothetical protein